MSDCQLCGDPDAMRDHDGVVRCDNCHDWWQGESQPRTTDENQQRYRDEMTAREETP